MADVILDELDLAALTVDLPEHSLIVGDIGTVVFVHGGGASYEVEFMTADGQTLTVETLDAGALEPIAGNHVLHARKRVTV